MSNKFDYLYGLDEVSGELNSHVDKGLKNEYIAHFANVLNCKTMRIWLKTDEVIKVKENDEIEFDAKGFINLHNYLDSLRRLGVERFLLLDWSFVYPYGYPFSDTWVVPDPKTEPEMYKRFLLLQKKVRYEIARNFTLITYFEATNEPDGVGGMFLHKNGYINAEDKESCSYTRDEIEDIVIDLNYFVTLGVKEANVDAKVLLPSFCNFDYAPEYLNDIYTKIESGKYPTIGVNKSKRIDDFFEILNFHPYNLKDVYINEYWLSTQFALHDISVNHHDGDRPVWFTEVGWSDFKRESERLEIGKRFIDLIEATKNKLPWVETIFFFRLFSLGNRIENEGEDNFGLVFNEYDWDYPLIPKPAMIDIYRYINGEKASLDPLFKYTNIRERNLFTSTHIGENKGYKVLIVSNHLAFHATNEKLGHHFDGGLGASSLTNDYPHVLYSLLKDKHHDVDMTVMNITTWEKEFYSDNLFEHFNNFKDEHYDLVVISIGDNVGVCSLNDHPFHESYEKMVKHYENVSKQVIMLNTFNKFEKVNDEINTANNVLKLPLLNINDLIEDKVNVSSKNYLNNEYRYCPSDVGHSAIAKLIYKAIVK